MARGSGALVSYRRSSNVESHIPPDFLNQSLHFDRIPERLVCPEQLGKQASRLVFIPAGIDPCFAHFAGLGFHKLAQIWLFTVYDLGKS